MIGGTAVLAHSSSVMIKIRCKHKLNVCVEYLLLDDTGHGIGMYLEGKSHSSVTLLVQLYCLVQQRCALCPSLELW